MSSSDNFYVTWKGIYKHLTANKSNNNKINLLFKIGIYFIRFSSLWLTFYPRLGKFKKLNNPQEGWSSGLSL